MFRLPAARCIRRPLARFAAAEQGNVAVIFAIMLFPTIYLLGMTLDYTQAQRRQSQLDAAADAAAIAAVTPSMMSQSTTVAQTTATNIFNATANAIAGGLTGNPILTVNVGNTGLVRTATVSYTANSSNAFPSLLGAPVWPIRGAATASASGAPNINFYLLLDDSPSMGIAATSDDITNMIAATGSQPSGSRSCAFACHEKNPSHDSGANSSTKDNLSIARSKNITLRIDLVAQATASLMSTAQTVQATQNNTYKAAIYTFDYGFQHGLCAVGAAFCRPVECRDLGRQQYFASHRRSSELRTLGLQHHHRLWHRHRKRAHKRQQPHALTRRRVQSDRGYTSGSGVPRHRRG